MPSSQALFKGYCVGNKYAFEIRDEWNGKMVHTHTNDLKYEYAKFFKYL